MRRRSKYGAIPTVVDGVRFASKSEARRDAELQLLQRAGDIEKLVRQPRFPLVIEGVKVATYVGDWRYTELRYDRKWDMKFGTDVCEDRKGVKTPLFKLKWALVQILYPQVKFRLS